MFNSYFSQVLKGYKVIHIKLKLHSIHKSMKLANSSWALTMTLQFWNRKTRSVWNTDILDLILEGLKLTSKSKLLGILVLSMKKEIKYLLKKDYIKILESIKWQGNKIRKLRPIFNIKLGHPLAKVEAQYFMR